MIIRHEPLGDPANKQHPLPENWQILANRSGILPDNFGIVEHGKLYRSAIVWPDQARTLRDHHGIGSIVFLIDGDWLKAFYDDPRIRIHQFPVYQRNALTFERIRDVVDVIDREEGRVLVHCLKGATRTSMVCAGYQALHGKNRLAIVLGNFGPRYGNWNLASLREMLSYAS